MCSAFPVGVGLSMSWLVRAVELPFSLSILWDVPFPMLLAGKLLLSTWQRERQQDMDAICLSGVLPRDHGPRGGLQVDVLAPSAGGECFFVPAPTARPLQHLRFPQTACFSSSTASDRLNLRHLGFDGCQKGTRTRYPPQF